MAIDITVGINRRKREIEELTAMHEEILFLVADAQRVAWGDGSQLTDVEFKRRVAAVEDTAARLHVALPYEPVDVWLVH